MGSLLGSIKKKASGLASSAKSKITSALKPSKQITSTLNEFSTVEKAVMFLKSDDSDDIEKIKVQINPNDLNYTYQTVTGPASLRRSGIDGDTSYLANEDSFAVKGSLSFVLYYDFYDEYYARSANGSGFSLNSLFSSGSFSLMEETYSSLKTIVKKSKRKCYVLFKWGPIKEYGIMETVSPSYNAFSPWGEPLKGNVSINLTLYHPKRISPDAGQVETVFDQLTRESESSSGISVGSALNKIGSTIKALR